MSFCSKVGVFLKFSKLLLRLDKWVVFAIMSMNCKLPGISGRLPAKSKAKEAVGFTRWRREFLFLSIFGGFAYLATVLLLLLSCNGRTWRMGPSGEKAFQRHNVSRDEIHNLVSLFFNSHKVTSFHCSKSPGHESPITDGVTCTLKMFGLENWEAKNWNVPVPERLESMEQCSTQDGRFHLHFDHSVLNINALFSAYRSIVSTRFLNYMNHKQVSIQPRSVEANQTELYEKWSLFFVKGCFWFLVGIICSRITSIHPKTPREMKEHLSPGQPSIQQRPNLLQQKQQQHAQTAPRSAGNWKRKLLILTVGSGVLLSMWLFWSINADGILSRKETLASMCDERARMLQDQFNVSMNHVHALAILVSTFHHGKTPSAIDQKTFGEYTERTSFERPLTSGVAYALKVTHSERRRFEEEHGWTIKKMESEDQTLGQNCIPENLDPAPVKDEYAPVIFSQETVSHIVSIDMMSGKEDRENILRARASGKGVLTSPFKLLKSNHLGVVLTFAVYNKNLPHDATEEERIGATAGYLGASYDMPSLVEKLLHQLASKQTIVVNVYDTTNASDPISMYGTEDGDRSLLHVSSLDFGDPSRKHEMQCRFKQKPPIPWSAISSSAGCLVITMLLGQILRLAINEIAQVEEDCQKMMELKARAEAADVAKSQFLATVSHEIRTPMNGVLGMLQMLLDTDLDATQMDYAQTAHASGKDLISLINEVLDQAKIESGRLELEHVPFDMRFVLDNVLSLFSGKANEKGVELAVYVSRKVPLVVGDPGRFRQIITNLVGNSIKFTREKGHIFVSVHLASEAKRSLDFEDEVLKQCSAFVTEDSTESNTLSGFPVVDRWKSWENFNTFNCTENNAPEKVELLVSVEDTGVGIPLDAQARIFTPFMQADSSTSRTYGGTGIGLSISKCLVELMQGEIGFVSKPGMGSTFSFTGVFAGVEREYMDTKLQQYDPAVLELQGLTALVVDCRSLRAEVTRYHLQRLGVSVDITSCLGTVCGYLSEYSTTSKLRKLDAVLIDKDVWDKEGFVAFHQMLKDRNENSGSGTSTTLPKMFLLATSISPAERSELVSSGFVDNIVAKPLRLSTLIACFQEAFGSGKNKQVNRRKRPNLGILLREKRILVVDDNMVNRRVAEGALKKYGAIVTCVGSGKAALSMLKPPHKFDACFMDLQMPEMDGFEATRQIRAVEKDTNKRIASGDTSADMFGNVAEWRVPILAMTADVIQATYEECMKCGMDDYVSKPFEEEQLYTAVARFFESA